ncbi:hemerythrin domain-containing protein [Glycomyces buryatensis]|uniref:Hemerythrin domain-containing protein n=1 Tax=Glycomyces buryatensis TaxID=2570927 RepID=A0A4S8PPF5_9ACTN|nr:hemerythrin domain-containing protein [Glycomyces buryatensis]THV32890.1 hemerythrin domain-containing protein [Glycomyces buryatensis]
MHETKTIDNMGDKLIEIHDALREQLDRVRSEADAHFAAAAESAEPPKPGLGLQLRQHCLTFCEFLTFHHDSEENGVFPSLAEHHPHLREPIDRLREEHKVVNRLKDEIAALVGDIELFDAAAFATELESMTDRLHAHLDYEETELIPVLAEIPFPPVAPPDTP